MEPSIGESIGGRRFATRFPKTYKTMIFGLGYGYPLAKLASRGVEKEGTRSPHSIFYFTLAYSGIVGFAIFCWLEICVLLLLWRVYKVTGQTFGLIYFIYTLIGAFFGNLIETPQAAIPLYLLWVWSTGPILLQTDQLIRPRATGACSCRRNGLIRLAPTAPKHSGRGSTGLYLLLSCFSVPACAPTWDAKTGWVHHGKCAGSRAIQRGVNQMASGDSVVFPGSRQILSALDRSVLGLTV